MNPNMNKHTVTAGNLPNTNDILDSIIKLLECMNTPKMKRLKAKDSAEYMNQLESKFSDFSDQYYTIFRMVIDGEDITPLFKMLEVINNINNGKTDLETGEKSVGQYLTKFLPPEILQKMENGELTEQDVKVNKKRL